MNELVNKLVEKVGLDGETAQKVVDFLKEHASEVPQWLASEGGQDILGKIKGELGGLFGGH
jgi:hypothetical protein